MRVPCLSRTVCLAALAGVAGTATEAAAQANCDMYGKLAVQQQQENVEYKCGFEGSDWSPDLKAHIDWCGSVGPEQWKVQLQKRRQQLDACKAK